MNAATMHSSGNSFIVCMKNDVAGHCIESLCRSQGVDGMVLLEKYHDGRYKLCFFNNDGSPFRMCFNGSLCAAMYLRKFFGAKDHVHFFTEGFNDFDAIFSKDHVSLTFTMPDVEIVQEVLHEPGGTCYSLSLTDNHKVILTKEDFFNFPEFTSLAMKLREADKVFPEGANVHFIHLNSEAVYIRHFEKGIEKETLSCGSGCVAAAIILEQCKDIQFISPGGRLRIKKHTARHWSLSGTPCLVSRPKLQ